MKKYLFILLSFLGSFFAKGQAIYNPGYTPLFTNSNKPYAMAKAGPDGGRTYKADSINFLWRPFNGVAEVKTYFPVSIPMFRTGQFPIVVNVGGSLQSNGTFIGGTIHVFWWKQNQADSSLVEMFTDPVSTTGFLLAANNLTDLSSIPLAKQNLALDLVNNTSDATKNSATVALTNHTIDANLNTLLHIPNSALTNSSIGITITSLSGSDIAATTTPAALGTPLVINFPNAGPSSRGPLTSGNWNFFNGKLDSVHISNDSVYNCVNGTCVFQSIIVGGNGVDTIYRTPGKDSIQYLLHGSYYAILDSVSPQQQFVGFLYNKNSWTNLADFTNVGATVSVIGNKLNFSGGVHNFNQTLQIPNPTCKEHWRIVAKIIAGTKTSTSWGPGLGIKSTNTWNGIDAIVAFDGTSNATSGNLTVIAVQDTVVVSASKLSFSAGDTLQFTVGRDVDSIYGSISNLTTNSLPISVNYAYNLSAGFGITLPNTGNLSVFSMGGTFIVDSLALTSTEIIHSPVMDLSDSKADYDVVNKYYRYGDRLRFNFPGASINAGPADRLEDALTRLAEFKTLQPQQVLLNIGRNSIAFGDDSNTVKTLYTNLTDSLISYGIHVIHLLPFYETTVNQLWFVNWIKRTFPGQYVDSYTATLPYPTDGVHLYSNGHLAVYNSIINSFMLTGGTHQPHWGLNDVLAYSNTNLVSNANNGVSDSAGFAQLGGSVATPSKLVSDRVIDDSTNFQLLWIKTSPKPAAVFDINKIGQMILGESQYVKAAVNTNYGSDTHAPFSSPLVINRVNTNAAGFNTVPFLTMSSADGSQLNGFFFQNQTFSNGAYFPVMYTYSNVPKTNGNINGYEHIVYMKQPSNTTSTIGTAFLWTYANLDKLDSSANSLFELDSVNPFVFASGGKIPFMMDQKYNLRVGYNGILNNSIVESNLAIEDNANPLGIVQRGLGSANILASSVAIGHVYVSSGPQDTAAASAILDVKSTTRGFLEPRMTTIQKNAISSPAEGLHVYDLTLHQPYYYNGTSWTTASGGITTASNGLTASAGNVVLGGALTGTTNITGANALNLGTSGSKLSTLGINTTSGTLIGTGGLNIGGSSAGTGPVVSIDGNTALNSGINTRGFWLNIVRGNTSTDASGGTIGQASTAYIGDQTLAATSATTYTIAASLIVNGAPTAGTNVTLTNAYGLWAGGNSYFNGNIAATNGSSATFAHFICNNAANAVGGAGAGSSPTVTIAGTDEGGAVTVLTGTTPSASAIVFTVTYAQPFANNSYVTLTPANAATAALSGTSMVYANAGTTNFTLNSSTLALTAATTYKWFYTVRGN